MPVNNKISRASSDSYFRKNLMDNIMMELKKKKKTLVLAQVRKIENHKVSSEMCHQVSNLLVVKINITKCYNLRGRKGGSFGFRLRSTCAYPIINKII